MAIGSGSSDNISVGVSVDTQDANRQIEKLVEQFAKLSASMDGLQSNFSSVSGGVGALASTVQNLQGTVSGLSNALSSVGSIARQGFSQIEHEVQNTAKSTSELQSALAAPRNLDGFKDVNTVFRQIQQEARNTAKSTSELQQILNGSRNLDALRNAGALNHRSLVGYQRALTAGLTGFQNQTVDIMPVSVSKEQMSQVRERMKQLKAETQRMAGEAGKAGGQAFSNGFAQNTSLQQATASITGGIRYLTMRFMLAGSAIGAAFVKSLMTALNVGSGFESQMTSVKVISGATAEEFDALTAKAREMGATLPITAQQAGAAMQVMAQRGTKVKDILTSVTDITNMAISQGIDLASAASLIGSTMTNFGIAVEDAARVTDVFNNAANQSALSATTLQTSMNYISPAAAAAGYSLESTVAAMEVLANAGLDASMVGTGLAMVIQKLSSENYVLGVSVKDAEGNMRPLEEIFKELQAKGMSLADATKIFGARASKAALNLTKYADTLGTLESNLRKTGSTSAAVEEKMKTFQNIWNSFQSATESVRISIFDQIEEQSKEAVSGLADVTRSLNDWIQQTGVAKKATDAFIEGLGFNVDLKGMIKGLDVKAVTDWARNMGETVKGVFNGIATAINTVKGPLTFLLKNLETLVNYQLGKWFIGDWSNIGTWIGALKTLGSATRMLGGLGNQLAGVGSGAATATGAFGKLSVIAPNLVKGLQMVGSVASGTCKALIASINPVGAAIVGVTSAAIVAYNKLQQWKQEAKDARELNRVEKDTNAMKNKVHPAFNAALEALKKGDRREFEIQMDIVGKWKFNTDKAQAEAAKMWKNLREKADKEAVEIQKALSAAMEEFNSELEKDEEHLKMTPRILEMWGGDIEKALKGSLPIEEFEKFDQVTQEVIKRAQANLGFLKIYGDEAGKAADKSNWRAPNPEIQVKREYEAREKAARMAAGMNEAQAEFDVKIRGDQFKNALKEFKESLEKSKDLLGEANIEIIYSTNAKELEKNLKEAAKVIAESMHIPEDVAFQGLIKEIDKLNKEGNGNEFTKRFVQDMGTAKKHLEDFINDAKDGVKYLGKLPESFLPSIHQKMKDVDKYIPGTNKISEEYKKHIDALNEFETSSVDKLMNRMKDAAEFLGESPLKFMPQFEALSGMIRKVDEATGDLTEGFKKLKAGKDEAFKMAVDQIAGPAKDALDYFGEAPDAAINALEQLMSRMEKFDPITKRVSESFKQARKNLEDLVNTNFGQVQKNIEGLKVAMKHGLAKPQELTAMLNSSKDIIIKNAQQAFSHVKDPALYKKLVGGKVLDDVLNQFGIGAYAKFKRDFNPNAIERPSYYDAEYRKQVKERAKIDIEYIKILNERNKQEKGQSKTQPKTQPKAVAKKEEKLSYTEAFRKEVGDIQAKYNAYLTNPKTKEEATKLLQGELGPNVMDINTHVKLAVSYLLDIYNIMKGEAGAKGNAAEKEATAKPATPAKETLTKTVDIKQETPEKGTEQDTSWESLIKENTEALFSLKDALLSILGGTIEPAELPEFKTEPEMVEGLEKRLDGILSKYDESAKGLAKAEGTREPDKGADVKELSKDEGLLAAQKLLESTLGEFVQIQADESATVENLASAIEQVKSAFDQIVQIKYEKDMATAEGGKSATDTASKAESESVDMAGIETSMTDISQNLGRVAESINANTAKIESLTIKPDEAKSDVKETPQKEPEQASSLESLIAENTQTLKELRDSLAKAAGMKTERQVTEPKTEEPAHVEATKADVDLSGFEAAIATYTKAITDAVAALANTGSTTEPEKIELPQDTNATTDERFNRLVEALMENTQALREAKVEASANVEIPAAGADVSTVQPSIDKMSTMLEQLSSSISQNTQALGTASTAMSGLSNANTGEVDTGSRDAINRAADGLSNMGASISENTAALRTVTSTLSSLNMSGGGGDVHINLHDFTVKQESDIQRIKQMIQDALRSAGLMRPGLGFGTV